MLATFVSEQIIDTVAEELGASEADFQMTLQELEEHQAVLLAYLFSDNFSLFTDKEREFLLFLVIVVYESMKRVNGVPKAISEEELSKAEEENWALLQSVKGKGFHERLDVFFQRTSQEDLLAFAEDALSDIEDGYVTKEGREAIFVAVKSVVDCWV
ncbi:MAG: hypothetical protein R2824_00745 [Saprospiraceae bacterium]|nr:hypothetical protein [Lewinella sp.]